MCLQKLKERKDMRVFTYGTLRKGEYNHVFLNKAHFEGVFELDGFIMRDIGGIPMVEFGDGSIVAERYRINNGILQNLDALEGVPFLYVRTALKIDGDNCYIYLKPAGRRGTAPIVEGGDWKKYRTIK